MATLLFLGASVSQLPAIEHARRAGHRIVAVDGDPHAVAFPFADVWVNLDFSDIERVADAGRENGVDGVLAISSDRAVLPAAGVADLLGLPGIGVDVARAMTDKGAMRYRLERAEVRQPKYVLLTAASNLQEPLNRVPTPAVLKPSDSGGQRGVFMIETVEDAEVHIDETLAFSRTGRAMLEEYVEGTELNGILVVRGGEPTLITLSDRLRPRGPAFGVGWIHSYPSSVSAAGLEHARTVAFEAVRALGLQNGIAFPQLIVRGEDVWLIEIAARIPAGQMADLVRYATGVELFEVAILQALGERVPNELITPVSTRPVAIRFLTAQPGVLPVGQVISIEGLEEVRSSPGVLAAGLYFGVGATIGPLRVDADRRGYVIATADTPQRALALADAATSRLRLGTRRDTSMALRPRLLVLAITVLAVAAAVAAALLFANAPQPKLIADSVSDQNGVLRVRYRFDEPVHAVLLVDGRPAEETQLEQSGALLWREHKGRHRLAIEGIDRAGHRSRTTAV